VTFVGFFSFFFGVDDQLDSFDLKRTFAQQSMHTDIWFNMCVRERERLEAFSVECL